MKPDALQDTAQPNPDAGVDRAAADVSPGPDGAAPDAALDGDRSDATDAPSTDASRVDGAPASDASIDSDSLADAMPRTSAFITFRLKNTGTGTVYLHPSCVTEFKVTSNADGTVYKNAHFCACECASSSCNGPLACSPCAPNSEQPIEAGAVKELTWKASSTTMQSKVGPNGSFECVGYSPLPTGPYTFSIALYANGDDATNEANTRTHEKTFTLDTTNATVEVPLQ